MPPSLATSTSGVSVARGRHRAAVHNRRRRMMGLTQAHSHPDAGALIARRRANGDGGLEGLRVCDSCSHAV